MTTAKMMTRDERIDALVAIYGLKCFFPGCDKPLTREEVTFDHWWVPQSQGGTWEIDNLRLMHKRCNAIKGDRIPNADGTLPPLKREVSLANRRAVRRVVRPEVCETCNSGRDLGPEDICDVCGSLPQPYNFPRWAQMRPKECPHSGPWHCWMCTLGFIEREAAIIDVLNGDELDEAI